MRDTHRHATVAQSSDAQSPDAVVRLLSFSAHLFGVQNDVVDALSRIYPHTASANLTDSTVTPSDSYVTDIWLDDIFGSDPADRPSTCETLGVLEYLLDTSALGSFNDRLLLHAGAVAIGDTAILFPAASGAGKSTLVAALAHSGFEVLSDEFAIFDLGTLRLRPFPKALCLKPGGILVVERAFEVSLDTVPVRRVNHQDVTFASAPHMFPVSRCAMIGAIVVLNRVPNATASLEALPRAAAIGTLLEQSLNVPHLGVAGLDTIVDLVESVDCLRLTYSDVRDAVGWITTLVSAARENAACGPTTTTQPELQQLRS